ncbi:hypothetical protein GLAREA_06470 [Glarea lozoyensis ATCC 20868]|uniref:PQ-loop-domain-containing protein n=1 Tax=Glarea lozoyensis (strain ATCC 20868 / MF5171) TaxID=1116229 RepID=S3D4T1_GLAL2|nr:uncharacterized protein GLAREA_06470 [Glarea lozoyensis ATCC 20868]EPE33457.1 hypothetical protein GLAREA_06470 [Glarea lozoyensis ATCC 20868]
MFPPSQNFNLDVTAISGICGSVSIACWVVVFSPQIIEQFRRGSADGLSLQFIIVWLLGDIFNILGAVLQGVLPTMIILAIYYTLADIVLLLQCFYYRGFTWHDEVIPPPKPTGNHSNGTSHLGEANERTGLLSTTENRERRPSGISETSVHPSHLSPAVPLQSTPLPPTTKPHTTLQTTLFNLASILMVISAGVFGWWLSERSQSPHKPRKHPHDTGVSFNLWGQIFGYFCALLYLGSRIPQLLLNYRRKSTSGVSMLFFLFACIGNLTYVLSIFAYEPHCAGRYGKCAPGEAGRLYGRYIAVNASWLAGSLGTLVLDMGIFVQFFVYRELEEGGEEEVESVVDGRERPLLERGDSAY